MRTLSAALMLMVAMAFGATGFSANQDKPKDGKVLVVVFEKIQDLNLTDEQEARIADIQKEFKPKVQEAAKELATFVQDEGKKINEVFTPEQQKLIKEMKEEREDRRQDCAAHAIARLKDLDLTDDEMTKVGEIRKEFAPKIEKAMKELTTILTDEQKKAREEALKAGKTRREVLAAMQITGEQKDKVEAIAKDLATLVREEMEKVRDVVAEGLKQKLADLKDERAEHARDRTAHRIANSKDLNLTDEQKTTLTTIRQEFRPKIHEAGNKLRSTVRDEVERIAAVLKGS